MPDAPPQITTIVEPAPTVSTAVSPTVMETVISAPPPAAHTVAAPPSISAQVEPQLAAATTLTVGQGPAGPPGPSGSQFEHTQSVAADAWTVNHNLGFRPNIQPLTLGGVAMIAEIIHSSANQALIYFDQPRAGLAICS